MLDLEAKFGFKIQTVQTDNGTEFINTSALTKKKTQFKETLKSFKIKHRRTQPYSPWQNGKVERSHRTDNDWFYNTARFQSVAHMYQRIKRYNTRYNNIHTKVLRFKNPNQIVDEYKHKQLLLIPL